MMVCLNALGEYSAEATNIESLPAEIKILLLLNLPDPASLRALVRASPSYHELYRRQRQHFLSIALFNCLSYTGLHIALTVLEASITLQETDNEDDEEEDLIYRKMRIRNRFFELPSSIHMSRHWLDNLDFDTLTSLLHYHWKIAAVASSYIEENLSTNPVTGEPHSSPGCHQLITRSESGRIYRALYHFELYCLLFGSHHLSSSPDQEDAPAYGQLVALNYVENQFSLRAFLPLLKSWEIEEIACIRTYIHHKYTSILQSCASELQQHELELRIPDHSPPTQHNREDPHYISTQTILSERKEYLLSLGLTFFSTLLSPSPSPTTRATLIHAHPHRRKNFLSLAISAYRELPPLSSHNQSEQSANRYNTEILTFISDENWEEGPNAALPWSKFSDLEAFYRGREVLRGWGYGFWDWGRLEGWGVLGLDVGKWVGGMDEAGKVLVELW